VDANIESKTIADRPLGPKLRAGLRPGTSGWIPFALTVILSCSLLSFGIFRPELNFDLIPYAALAKELRGAGGKHEVYRELEAKIGSGNLQRTFEAPYNQKMYADDAFFEKNLPFYKIKPLYILLCSAFGLWIGNDVTATYVVSAIAAALAVLLSYAIGTRTLGLSGAWRLAIPLSWSVFAGLHLAELSTPDALATLLTLAFVYVWASEAWSVGRVALLVLLACLSVAARTDAVLFIALLLLLRFALSPPNRSAAVLVLIAASATYVVIQAVSNNYGYVALINLAMVNGTKLTSRIPDTTFHVSGYLRSVARGIAQMFGDGTGLGSLYLLATTLAFLSALREWRLRDSWEYRSVSRGVFALSSALILFLVSHFVLYPAPSDPRFVMNAYVLSGLVFARAAQLS
jgi:hypothetical protein